jgi:poly(A) polymerase
VNEVTEQTRRALSSQTAWLVGGALRDRLMGRETDDLDIVVDGDPELAARAVARAARGAAFELSDSHGAWRVVDRGHRWQVDLTRLRGGSLEADLALRDFTVNSLAEPLGGGPIIDPTGGLADLEARRLRMVGSAAFTQDPLRSLRLARLACELELEPEAETIRCARECAPELEQIAAERVFAELRRIVACSRVASGLDLMDELGLTAVVLPELISLRGVAQSRFHHLDVHDHTRAVLDAVVELERDPASAVGSEHAAAVAELLDEPLADGVSRGVALRFGALLHDAAKPATRAVTEAGRVTFIGHDAEGAQLATDVMRRLRASERLQSHVADLTRHHLRLGFLVAREPLRRRDIYRYLSACEPVEVDVTLLSIADRLATRGDNAEHAIAAHLALADRLLGEALAWRSGGRPAPLLRGDDLVRSLDLAPGPEVGRLLEAIAEARFAGEVTDREQALEHARRLLSQ